MRAGLINRPSGAIIVAAEGVIGPVLREYPTAMPVAVPIDSANASIAQRLQIPKSGTITKIGCYAEVGLGTPPAANFALVTCSLTTGYPSLLAYGGSSIQSVSISASGFNWYTLDTPAVVDIADKIFAIRFWPGATPPSGTDYANLYKVSGGGGNLPQVITTTAALTTYLGQSHYAYLAAQYDDGTTIGLPETQVADLWMTPVADQFGFGGTYDEMGAYFTLPVGVRCIGFKGSWGGGAGAINTSLNIKLYDSDGVTVLKQTGNFDSDIMAPASIAELFWWKWTDGSILLRRNHPYYLSIVPATSNAFRLGHYNLPDAASRSFCPEGLNWQRARRVGGGAWDLDTTKLPVWGIWYDAIYS